MSTEMQTRIRKEATGGWWIEVRQPIGRGVYKWTPTRWTAGTRRDAAQCERELRADTIEGVKRNDRRRLTEVHCFWCGEDVGESDWDYVGNVRLWVCSKSECNRELQKEQQGARDERFLDAIEDDFARY